MNRSTRSLAAGDRALAGAALAAAGARASSRTRCWPIRRSRRARARSARDLRCLVCQNQSIDNSDADLARDLRLLVRERLSPATATSRCARSWSTRYGDFVLLDPPVKPKTWGLWFGPAAMLLRRCRRHAGLFPPPAGAAPEPPLSAERGGAACRAALEREEG